MREEWKNMLQSVVWLVWKLFQRRQYWMRPGVLGASVSSEASRAQPPWALCGLLLRRTASRSFPSPFLPLSQTEPVLDWCHWCVAPSGP